PPPPLLSTLSLHDALPICASASASRTLSVKRSHGMTASMAVNGSAWVAFASINAVPTLAYKRTLSLTVLPEATKVFSYLCFALRSEEHTSELQSRFDLVCR